MSKSSYYHPLRPAPPILNGRTNELNALVSALSQDAPSRVCVLGLGGIGKTSLALAAIHQRAIVTRYGAHRYFFSCDAITNANALTSAFADIFDLNERDIWSGLRRAQELVDSPMLFFLDNFETTWESSEARDEVEKFLSKLSEVPQVSLIVTMRGAERPHGVSWTRPFLPALVPLYPDAARQTFLDVSDAPEDTEGLSELITILDGHPLAITLMAAQAQYTDCSTLLQQWDKHKTSMLSRGIKDRLSSLDVSMEASIRSVRVQQSPDAIRLLQVLSFLPDGANRDDLMKMTTESSPEDSGVTALLQVSLAYRDPFEKIRCLAPTREYVRKYFPINELDFTLLLRFHASLGSRARASQFTADRTAMQQDLALQIGNIHTVLRYGLHCADRGLTTKAITGVIDTSCFHSNTFKGSIVSLLQEANAVAIKSGSLDLQARCLEEQAHHVPWSEKCSYYEQSLPLFRELGDKDDICRVLVSYSHILTMTARSQTSTDMVKEAADMISTCASPFVRAWCLEDLSNIYLQTGAVVKAAQAAREGLSLINHEAYPSLASLLLQRLSICCAARGILPQAARYLKECDKLMSSHNDVYAGGFYIDFGQILLIQSHLEDAERYLLRSQMIFEAHQDSRSASARTHLGNLYLARKDYESAETCFHMSLADAFKIGHKYRQAWNVIGLGQVEMQRENYVTAGAHYALALQLLKEMNRTNTHEQITLLFPQANLLICQTRFKESLTPSVLAAILSKKTCDTHALSMALQRIGDVFYHDSEDFVSASACYNTCLDLIRYIGVQRHISECLLRLGMIDLQLHNQIDVASRRFRQAREFGKFAEASEVCDYADARLNACSSGIVEAEFPLLPLGTFLF